jgi:CheY-like chemotaxis protein
MKMHMSGRQRMRVLIVDGCADNGGSLSLLFGMLGHEVTAVLDAMSALRVVRERAPDLIIAELALPRAGGLLLAEQLRGEQLLSDTMLAAHSGYCRACDRENAAEAGFDAFIAKPGTLAEF